MTTTKDELIVAVWNQSGRDVVSASDLTQINAALAERFGSEASPASIARVLADHGARLGHPEILLADARWRESHRLFTPDDLAFDTINAADAFIQKLERLRHSHDQQSLRYSVQLVKHELDVLATVPNVPANRRAVAGEAAQWLTVWLQNPQIFAGWLDLRRSTVEFRELFGTFPPP